MVKSGHTKRVEATHWYGRLRKARHFLDIAKTSFVLAPASADGGPIMSNCILSAVAYADTLTASVSGIVNQGDHAELTKVLRGVLGTDLPKAQEMGYVLTINNRDKDSVYLRAATNEATSSSIVKEYLSFSFVKSETCMSRKSLSKDLTIRFSIVLLNGHHIGRAVKAA